MTASALYAGTIRHRRFAVKERGFRHRIAMLYVDLDELPRLVGGRLVRPGPGLVRVRRRDFLGGTAGSDLADGVRALVRERTGTTPDGPIRLLCQPRILGMCFNPVSFYYCFDRDERLVAIVAEVTNTPWGERHAYVLPHDPDGDGRIVRGGHEKVLHVSPFMPMEQRYDWRVAPPGERLSVHIENHDDDGRAFDATLALARRPLTRTALAGLVARHPLATLRVLALIYGHAAVIALRRIPHHPHPGTAPS